MREHGIVEDLPQVRQMYRHHKEGYSNDKGKSMRHVLRFKPWVLFNAEFKKYFDPMMDKHEARKGMYEFARKYPWSLVVEKT